MNTDVLSFASYSIVISLFLYFQLPELFSQFKEAMNVPSLPATLPAAPVGSTAPLIQSVASVPIVSTLPSVPVPAGNSSSVGPPAIDVIQDSDSDPDVHSLTIPFRSGATSSEIFIPMISTDDAWITNQELRYFSIITTCNLSL